ncbi:N-acetyltransferase [Dictyobacter alpinus]|uniref:N-acetyltransferase n=1 Tax=Dictyobacter alpinus TaxID=2014873 RepID=A0A402BEK8_9CHLR|nr:GNAT family N-acetyltransferase [Dictyobacter alpinus]GCE29759.1 N-acetyltransferase [Dictyobacter alpinus]
MGLHIQLDTFPVLDTERLILRQLAATDAQDAFLFLSDEENMRYYDPAPMTRLEQAEKSIERHRRRFAEQEALRWGIVLKGENKIIGTCGYSWDTDNHYAVLSYILSKHSWKKGIMTEALTAIIQFGFEHIHLHRIEAQVAYPNLASARLLEKLGFQEEGRLRDRQYVDHQFVDERIFALLNPKAGDN